MESPGSTATAARRATRASRCCPDRVVITSPAASPFRGGPMRVRGTGAPAGSNPSEARCVGLLTTLMVCSI